MDTPVLFSTNSVSKADIESFSNAMIQTVKDGINDPLKIWVKLKALEKSIELIQAGIKDMALAEAEKHKGQDAFGASIAVKELGTKYDFHDCGDQQFHTYYLAEKDAQFWRKKREDFLKGLKEPMDVVDGEGVVTRLFPPVKKSTTGIAVTIK